MVNSGRSSHVKNDDFTQQKRLTSLVKVEKDVCSHPGMILYLTEIKYASQ